jgi:hypothetical protein
MSLYLRVKLRLRPPGKKNVEFEVLTAVAMKRAILWHINPCSMEHAPVLYSYTDFLLGLLFDTEDGDNMSLLNVS